MGRGCHGKDGHDTELNTEVITYNINGQTIGTPLKNVLKGGSIGVYMGVSLSDEDAEVTIKIFL